MSRSTWTLGTPIRTDARLVEILTAIERQCLRTSVELDARDLVAELAGNTPEVIRSTYAHLLRASKAEAMAKLQEVVG